jgi:hypothetical protein
VSLAMLRAMRGWLRDTWPRTVTWVDVHRGAFA